MSSDNATTQKHADRFPEIAKRVKREIKFCRHCGADHTRLFVATTPGDLIPKYAIYCRGCESTGPWMESYEAAMKMWNGAGSWLDNLFRPRSVNTSTAILH